MRINWEEKYKNAIVPSIVELSGEYSVKMLTGPFMFLNLFHDKKFFLIGKGCNFIGNMEWGNFIVREDTSALLLDYNVEKNTFTRGIGDYVKRLEDGKYLGKFTWHGLFFGYFLLNKIKE